MARKTPQPKRQQPEMNGQEGSRGTPGPFWIGGSGTVQEHVQDRTGQRTGDESSVWFDPENRVDWDGLRRQ